MEQHEEIKILKASLTFEIKVNIKLFNDHISLLNDQLHEQDQEINLVL